MTITANASIEICSPSDRAFTPRELRKLQNELNEELEDAVYRVLDRWKIENDQIHPILVDELYVEKDVVED
jgi:hypothetical protein